jgi:hypothetical protein
MTYHEAALGLAGIIGSGVAVVHGVLVQRLMVTPLVSLLLAEKRIAAPIRRLVPGLLHFSTFSWFLGGLTLIAGAIWMKEEARLVAGLFVGCLYTYGAIGNL